MRRVIATTALLTAVTTTGAVWAYTPEPDEEAATITQLVLDAPATIERAYPTRYEPIFVSEPPPVPDVPQPDWPCVHWYATSIEAGFEHSDWPDLGTIMWRESRCFPDAYNGSDPAGGSRGLTQVNGSWRGYLRRAGVLWDITELFDPLTNLRAARTIVQYDRDRGRCDYQQWATKQGLC